MFLTDFQIDQIADRIVAKLRPVALLPLPSVPRRLTVIDFGACCALSGESIRKKIRSRFIPREMVEGRPGGTYYVDRAALAKFNVSLEAAAERLAEHRVRIQPAFAPRANNSPVSYPLQ